MMGSHRSESTIFTVYARHIGRVGALAVALGVGMAVAGPPGLAWAEETGASTTSPGGGADGGTGPGPDGPGGDEGGTLSGNLGSISTAAVGGPANNEDELAAEGEDEEGYDELRQVEQTENQELGGEGETLHVTEAGEQQSPTRVQVDPLTLTPAVERAETGLPGVNASQTSTDPTAQDISASAAVPAGAPSVPAAVTPTGHGPVVVDLSGPIIGLSAPQQQLSEPSVLAVQAAAPILLPPPTVTKPPVDPLAFWIELPTRLVSFATDLITAVLAPLLGQAGPAAPADAPLLWAVLAFVRRQFFNSGPALAPGGQTVDSTTGELVGNLGATDGDGDPLSYTVMEGPGHGQLTLDAAGRYVYSPDPNYVGADSFTVMVRDSGPHLHGLDGLFSPHGGHAVVAIIGLTAVAVDVGENDAPTITATPNASSGVIRYTVVTADSDGDAVAVTVSGPSHGTLVPDLATPGVYVYTPDPAYAHHLHLNGSTTPGSDEITFTATDPDGAIGTVTARPSIAAVNAAPTVGVIIADTGVGDGSKTVTLTVFDTDGDTVTVSFASPQYGSFDQPNGTESTVNPGQSLTLTYTPDPARPGIETLSFSARDAYGGAVTATAQVSVTDPEPADPVTTPGSGDVVQILEIFRNPVNGHFYATTVRENVQGDVTSYSLAVFDLNTNTRIGGDYAVEAAFVNDPAAPALIDDSVVDAAGNVYHNVLRTQEGAESVVVVFRPDGTSEVLFTGTATTALPLALTSSTGGGHVYVKALVLGSPSEVGTPSSTISLIDLVTGAEVEISSFTLSQNTGIAFALSLYSHPIIDADGRIFAIDVEDGTAVLAVRDDSGSWVPVDVGGTPFKVAASADGEHIYALVGELVNGTSVTRKLVDVASGVEIVLPTIGAQGQSPFFSDMAVSDDGTKVLLIETDGLLVIDTVLGTVTPLGLDGEPSAVITDVAFSTDATKAYVVVNNSAVIRIVTLPHDDDEVPTEGQLTLDDLQDLVDSGVVEVSFDDDGKVRVIEGMFSQDQVLDRAGAVELLNSLAALIGAPQDYAGAGVMVEQNLVGLAHGVDGEVTGRIYRLTHAVNGIRVLGSQTILATDEQGNVTGLFTTYDDALDDVLTTPSSAYDTESEAILATRNYIASRTGGGTDEQVAAFLDSLSYVPQLVIYDLDSGAAPRLRWQVEVFVTPDSGDFDPGAPGAPFGFKDQMFYVDARGAQAGTVTLTLSPGLVDASALPEIWTYISDGMSPGLPDSTSPRAVTAATNIALVFDYYRDVLERTSFDGDGAPIRVTLMTDRFGDAAMMVLGRDVWFLFGTTGWESALDVVAHEFTHAVIASVVTTPSGTALAGGLAYLRESGALNESFADILGVLVEEDHGEGRWLMGEDVEETRDLSTPFHYDDYLDLPLDEDAGGVHRNNEIFNFAAYTMMTDERTASITDEQWAGVFYGALFRLQPNAKFLDGRSAVINSAKTQGFTGAQIQAIKDAFDATGIVDDHMMIVEV